MEMRIVWSLVLFGIIAAAKVGCKGSCTRSESQADKGEWPEQNPQHIPAWSNLNFVLQDDVANCHALLLKKPEDLRSFERGSQKHSIWKATAKNGLLSLVVFGEVVRIVPFFW